MNIGQLVKKAVNYTTGLDGFLGTGVRDKLSDYKIQKPRPLPDGDLSILTGVNMGSEALKGTHALWEGWVARFDQKINKELKAQGTSFPIYQVAKRVDLGYQEGLKWARSSYESLLKDLEPHKNYDKSMFEWLTLADKDRDAGATRLGLSKEQTDAASRVEKWLIMNQFQGGVDGLTYLQKLHNVRNGPQRTYSMFPPEERHVWERFVQDKANYSNNGSLHDFMSYTVEQSASKRWIQSPLKDMRALVNSKGVIEESLLPSEIKQLFENYAQWMESKPDWGKLAINKTLTGVAKGFNEQIRSLNKRLPSGFEVSEISESGNKMLERLLSVTMASGLGLRPATIVRDFLGNGTNALAVLGPKDFLIGLKAVFTAEGRKAAYDAGVMLNAYDIGGYWGKMLEDTISLPDKIVKTMLTPMSWADNVMRTVVYNAESQKLAKWLSMYREGKAGWQQVENRTSIWLNEGPVNEELHLMASSPDVPLAQVIERAVGQTIDTVNFTYRKGTAPKMMRSGVGRVFGQYGTYSMNYIELLKKISNRLVDPRYRANALRAGATLAAVSYGLGQGAAQLGIETAGWFGFGPAAFSGGPALELVKSAPSVMSGGYEGTGARKTWSNVPGYLVPGYQQGRALYDAWTNKSYSDDERIMRALGFKIREKDDDWISDSIQDYISSDGD